MFGKKDESKNFKFSLGDKVKDKVTGYQGILTHRSQWLNNCNTYGVQRTELKDGLPQDPQHFDELQLELVEEKVVKEQENKTGGPVRQVPQPNR